MQNSNNHPNRRGVGPFNMAMYLVGVVTLSIGLYVSTITRIYLLTGATTHPYLGIGIPLAAIGLILTVVARVVSKRTLSR